MDELEARARRQLDSLDTVNERLAAIVETETSPDGEVTATVDGVGALVDLKLSERVSKLSGSDFASLVVSTAHAACHRAFARRAKILEEFNTEFTDLVSPGEYAENAGSDDEGDTNSVK
ncbi:YbaB/EbfC family DNA-binding protein [Gordonia araii NBRC 100433]|nr:YbaB/EbfC family DNA-binding protein [Gordonia araii NBRC 100433]